MAAVEPHYAEARPLAPLAHGRTVPMTVSCRLLAGVALVTTLASGAQAQSAPQRVRLGTLAPQGTSYHRILQEMGEQWRTGTNGAVQLTVYAGTMGSELEI